MKGIWFILSVVVLSCAQKKSFSGAASGDTKELTHSLDNSVDQAQSVAPAKGVEACAEGDKLVVAWSGPIKECIDAGKTWHFESKTCVDMPKAAFSCDWKTLQAELSARNLLTETLQKDADAGAKLVSCGQSKDGNRIAVQWLRPMNTVSCEKVQEGFGVVTGCYTHYVDQDPPPPASNDAERRQRVMDCLKAL